jgi:pilus assembly protein CpaE
MQALVISDNKQIGDIIRAVLVKHSYVCEAQDIISLSRAASAVHRDADLVVLHISSDLERAMALLTQLRHVTIGRIIAVGPNGDAKLILRTLHGGAEHYLDEEEVEQELRETLANLESLRMLALREPGRSICVIKSSGGSGCSTLAANLAVLIAREHKKCALIDVDLASDDLTALLNLKPSATLVDLEKYATKMDRSVFERSLTRHESGVSLLASSRFHEDTSQITSRCIREVLDWGRTLFPYVVVDVGQPSLELKWEALRTADVILLVFRLDFTSLRNVKREVEHLEKHSVSRERIILVVNRFGQPQELSATEAEESLAMKIAHYIVDDPKTANEANNKGIPIVIDSPRSKISNGFAQLAKGIGIVDHPATANEANSKGTPIVPDPAPSKVRSGLIFLARGLGLSGNAGQ